MEKFFIEEVLRRRDVFENIDKYLKIIRDLAKIIDPKAEIYTW